MKSFEHVYQLHRLLKRSRYPVPFERVRAELECSRATARRVLAFLRDSLGAPIESCRDPRGYRYTDEAYELPGLWFRADELHALLALQQLLRTFQPGLLDDALAPLRGRVDRILEAQGLKAGEVRRIRLLRAAARAASPCFVTAAEATLSRKRLGITYQSRGKGEITQREISPQRLTHYRDNWYLDAWCHNKRALRSFAVDRIRQARILSKPTQEILEERLDAHFASSYGIFAGKPKYTARLRFTPERARWVADEQWHPRQKARFDGSHYVLEVPYSDPRELIQDILKHGPDVEVLAPAPLRREVAERLRLAAQRYTDIAK